MTTANPGCVDYLFKYIIIICRGLGIIVALSTWGISINLIQMTHYKGFAGWYLVGVAIALTIFESFWMINQSPCMPEQGKCANCWACIMWIEDWRKTVIYVVMTVPLFWKPSIDMTLVLVEIILIIVLATMYLIKSFDCRSKTIDEDSAPYKPPVTNTNKQLEYRRFSNETEQLGTTEAVTRYQSNEARPTGIVITPDPGPQH